MTALLTIAFLCAVSTATAAAPLLAHNGTVAHFTHDARTFIDAQRRVAVSTRFTQRHPIEWSDDGRYMAYLAGEHDATYVEVQSAWTGERTPVLTADGDRLDVRVFALSPDGAQLAYSHDRALYTLDIATGAVKHIRDLSGVMIRALDWSPDGRTLAVGVLTNDSGDIALVDLKTGGVEFLIYRHPIPKFTPSFSPDGTRIAYRGMITSYTRVFVLDLATDAIRELPYDINDGYVISSIQWSPDGAHLLYPVYTSPFADDAERLETIHIETASKATLSADSVYESPFWLP